MQIQKAAACLAVAVVLLAGCSQSGADDGNGKSAKSGAEKRAKDRAKDSAEDAAGGSAADGTVTVEFKVTGDSPASVYIPGINSPLYSEQKNKNSHGDPDLDLDKVRTPWSKKFKVKPARSLSLQAGSSGPKTEIGCQILVDGKVIDQETNKNKPGSTLTAGCSGTTPLVPGKESGKEGGHKSRSKPATSARPDSGGSRYAENVQGTWYGRGRKNGALATLTVRGTAMTMKAGGNSCHGTISSRMSATMTCGGRSAKGRAVVSASGGRLTLNWSDGSSNWLVRTKP